MIIPCFFLYVFHGNNMFFNTVQWQSHDFGSGTPLQKCTEVIRRQVMLQYHGKAFKNTIMANAHKTK